MAGSRVTCLLLLAAATMAHAHVNERGMDYRAYKNADNVPCCNDEDCRPATEYVEEIKNGRPVVRLLVDSHWIEVSRSRVVAEGATDGRAHWCGTKVFTGGQGAWLPQTRCLILPPKTM